MALVKVKPTSPGRRAVVKVVNHQGRAIGVAHYSSTSQICLRLLSTEMQEIGREFLANTNTVALHTDDVAAMRALLQDRGVTFSGETIDTGVCHMAVFADPDGNPLMLHGRYVPRD